jgi:Uma2 family endonuclease
MTVVDSEPRTFRFTLAEYDRLVALGMFDGRRVELIEGAIVERMSPQGSRHTTGGMRIERALRAAFPAALIRVQYPLALGDSEPEPDVAVVTGTLEEYVDAHPTTALIVAEVADSSVVFDRETKGRVYARAGIPEYWLLDLTKQRLEVRRDPRTLPGEEPGYASVQLLRAGDVVTPLGAPGAKLAVADLLP